MSIRGRPLGFLGLVLAGWIMARMLMLFSGSADAGQMAVSLARVVPAVFAPTAAAAAVVPAIPVALRVPMPAPASVRIGREPAAGPRLSDAQIIALYGLRYFYEVRPDRPAAVAPAGAAFQPGTAPGTATGAAVASTMPAGSRWSVSAWLMAREGGADPRLTPLLGGSQAGVRLSYALDDRRRTALFARATAPLAHGGAEVAAGLQWRPTRAPVTAFVEARARNGEVVPAAGAFGGGKLDLPAGFRLESYGQAGWVGGRDASAFADGQARAARPVAHAGPARIDLGIGVWGAAQRGAARLDVGPGVGVGLPLGTGGVRLGLDWRQRVAGHAAPGSGPALTLGAGF